MTKRRILVVDDESNLIASIYRLFSGEDVSFHEAYDGKEGLKKVMEISPEVVVVDYKMPLMDGMEFLKAIQSLRPDIPVVVMTAHGDKSTSVEFLKEGAFRYLEKPFRPDEFRHVVFEAVDHHRLKNEKNKLEHIVGLDDSFDKIIGNSPEMHQLFDLIHKVAHTDITVLVQGESGTGKELIAQAIHERSGRSSCPFIRFNCAALPETLIESELFGHEKGAFTGAEDRKLGRFELADKGTLFFDEIGELNLNMQVKLLRVLQEKEFERVGGTDTIQADVRIVAATNQNLEEMMQEGRFREDLFYRLNSFPLHVMPLRERGDDILLLSDYFLEKFSKEYNVKVKGFTDSARTILRRYQWKGNVRELQNVISRAVILSGEDGQIDESALYLQSSPKSESFMDKAFDDKLTEYELVKLYAKEVYRRCGFNKKLTAEHLDINYRTLMSRLG